MVAQQQLQIIEQRDTEVKRYLLEVNQYQAWSTLPADAQPKIQRLIAQFEKAQLDTSRAEQIARKAQNSITALNDQIDDCHKMVDSKRKPLSIPEFETQSAEVVNITLQNWLEEELSNLHKGIKDARKDS